MSENRECNWRNKLTDMPYTYHAMGPISEKYELLMQGFEKKYGEKWYNKEEEIGKKLLEEVCFYDQVVSTVSKGVVCAECLVEDDKIYQKYRKNEQENNTK